MNKIIERIKKLLALAECAGASDGEASNAAEKAHALLAEYNLSLSDITTEEQKAVIETFNYSGVSVWKHHVWQAVAKLHFCDYAFSIKRGNSTVRFLIGRPVNIESARLVAEYLCDAVNTEARKAGKGKGKQWATQFKRGCSFTIAHRLYAKLYEAKDGKTESETGTALALRPVYEKTESENAERLAALGVKAERQKRVVDDDALRAGMDAGANINLNRPIGA